MQVGDRIHVAVHKTVPSSDGSSPEVVISGSQHEWEVAAIEAAEDDGRRAGVRGWRGAAVPIWDGVLVLRRVAWGERGPAVGPGQHPAHHNFVLKLRPGPCASKRPGRCRIRPERLS